MKFKQRACGLIDMTNFEGAKIAIFNDRKRACDFVEKLLKPTEGTVALLLKTSSSDVINAEGGGGASSVDSFTMCGAAIIKQKGEDGVRDGAGGLK